MKRAVFDAVRAARAEKRAIAVITDLADGAQSISDGHTVQGDIAAAPQLLQAVQDRIRNDKSGTDTLGERELFIQVWSPPLRLILVGAVHIAQPLVPIATATGYAVTIVDPRGAFATRDRFPGIDLTDDWPDEAIERLKPDHRTAIVTLTHDPKLDDPALDAALKSDAFYIGALGSRKTHAARLKRLTALGHDQAALDRIHGPVGLSINAASPAEIAISIVGQITQVLRRPPDLDTSQDAAA